MRIFRKLGDKLVINRYGLLMLKTYYEAIYSKKIKSMQDSEKFVALVLRRNWQYDPKNAQLN